MRIRYDMLRVPLSHHHIFVAERNDSKSIHQLALRVLLKSRLFGFICFLFLPDVSEEYICAKQQVIL